jgi:hypothetical protein
MNRRKIIVDNDFCRRISHKDHEEDKEHKEKEKGFCLKSKRGLYEKITDKTPFFLLLCDLLFLCVFVRNSSNNF